VFELVPLPAFNHVVTRSSTDDDGAQLNVLVRIDQKPRAGSNERTMT
jgi:hypothetical protein